MQVPNKLDQVDDPVAHISISGVHGRAELDERLAHIPSHGDPRRATLGALVIGVVIGAAVMYALKRD